MSTLQHYEEHRNANIFISNNANPFLISPYAPSQISRTTGNNILAADIIKPYTPNGTIQVQGRMNFPTGSELLINSNIVFTNQIYSGGGLGGVSWVTQDTPTLAIIGTFNAQDQVEIQPGSALFTEISGGYSLTVNGTVTTSNLVFTKVEDHGPRTATGKYVGVTVNGTSYYLPLYM